MNISAAAWQRRRHPRQSGGLSARAPVGPQQVPVSRPQQRGAAEGHHPPRTRDACSFFRHANERKHRETGKLAPNSLPKPVGGLGLD